MKSAGYYFMRGGRQVWAATVAEIRKLAQLAADELGKPVKVQRAARSKAAPMKRNPASRPDFSAAVAAKVKAAGYRVTPAAWRHIEFMARQGTASVAGASNLVTMYLREGFYKGSPYAAAPIKAKRNPAIRGVDFTGEEWTVAGLGKRGRLAVTEGTRQDAERMADQLFNEGYRALTIRRTAAPKSKPTRGAARPTIDVRPVARKGRRA